MDTVVVARLQKHIQDSQLHEPMKSAYRPAYITETALVRVTNDILCAVDRQQVHVVIIVLLHLSAVFDTVDHNNYPSPAPARGDGVPQGSVLGPILFTYYTNQLEAIAGKRGLGLHLYEVDTQLYIALTPVGGGEVAIERVDTCVTEMRSWMRKNKLQLNDANTKPMAIIMFCVQPLKG